MSKGPLRKLWLLSTAFMFCAISLPGENQPSSNPNDQRLRVHSDILKQDRTFSVSKPDEYESGTDRYPVSVILWF
jgi:hypothetical protein